MAVKRGGLGKGLDSLIPASQTTPAKKAAAKPVAAAIIKAAKEVQKNEVLLDISKIEPNRDQPRKKFDEDALKELSESIKQYGVLQPLIVQKKKDYYAIIAGERRWRASKLAGLKKIPVIIKDFSPQEMVEVALIENIQREDLNPIEEAMAYQRLIDEFGLKQEEAAKKVSKSRTAVTNSLRLLKLDARVKEMIINEEISGGHARALLSLSAGDAQAAAAEKIIKDNLSVRDTEKLVKVILEGPRSKAKKQPLLSQEALIYKDLEKRISNIIGSKVKISKKTKKKGSIEIEYYSNEDLERIIELLETIE